MIRAVSADKPGFKAVSFEPGFNVIVSETTSASTKKDSRNGTGKTALIDIIHFCLGGSIKEGSTLGKPEIKDYTFLLQLDLLGKPYSISRSVSDPDFASISGDLDYLRIQNLQISDTKRISVTDLKILLGRVMFGLPEKEQKYTPTFRAIIPYFIRRLGRNGTFNPFESFSKQRAWSIQVCNAYLLGLNWEDAQRFQKIKDKEKRLENIKEMIKEKEIPAMSDDVGELETEKIRLDQTVSDFKQRISSFRVHERYNEIEKEANELTERIHEASDRNITLKRSIFLYQDSLKSEVPPETTFLERVYDEAKINLSEMVKKELLDARRFHKQIILNRRTFLENEIDRLETTIVENEKIIGTLSEMRAKQMEVLQTHGALAEFTVLNEQYAGLVTKANILSQKIIDLKRFNQGKNSVKTEKVQLEARAISSHQEIKEIWEHEIRLFNEFSQQLYELPGNLIINIRSSGFKFEIKIVRGDSEGFTKMKIFCYDLVLGKIWSTHNESPGFIVHDSAIFDGVDSRQVAHALELASKFAPTENVQYICCMNSDAIPTEEFSSEFRIDSYIRLQLKDTESGGLFGFRF